MEHSIWLGFIKPRLELLKNLLNEDGVVFIQIDDNEQAYLKVLCDEIFGRNNFISTICVKMSTASGVKTSHREKTIIKEKEMILVYAKNVDKLYIKPQYRPTNEYDNEFQYYLEKNGSANPDDWEVLKLKDVLSDKNIPFDAKDEQFLGFLNENKDKVWRRAFIRNEFKAISQKKSRQNICKRDRE